jgi:hypothetical protein
MHALYELVPVIGEVIASHCRAETRSRFVRSCLRGEWDDARAMIEGMLAEPWLLKGHQETRLREFLELLNIDRRSHYSPTCRLSTSHHSDASWTQ